MTQVDLNKFKEKVEKEKCDGEITEEKLSGFISNYNRNGHGYNVYIYNNTVEAVPSVFGSGVKKDFTNTDSKIDAMITIMAFVIGNGMGMSFTFNMRRV